jgi:hypothetical protein
MSTSETRPCPFCGETIQQAAIRCRFCGEIVRRDGPPAEDATQFLIPTNVSGWAMFACYGGLVGMCVPIAGLALTIPALIAGIIALKRRSKTGSYGAITGNIRAVLGIVFATIGTIVWGLLSVAFIAAWLDNP